VKNILSGPRSNQYGTIKQHFLTFTSWRLKTSNYINDEKPSWNHTHPSFFNVLWQVHSICQSKFTIECRIMFPLSSYSIWSFPCGHPVAAYFLFPSSRPFFLSLYFLYLSIKKMIYRAVTPQDVTNICSLPFIVSRMSLSSLSLRNIFFILVTRSVQMNFCILSPKPRFKIFFSKNTVRAPHSESVKYSLYLHNLFIPFQVHICSLGFSVNDVRVFHPNHPIFLWLSPT
jgi:hypothetical protein